jgi:uncharacterized protein (DUF927 family)
MELLAGDGTVYRERLLSMGLHIGPGTKARNRLHEYIQTTIPAMRATSVSRLGWHGPAFVMPDMVYGAKDSETVIYQPVRQDEHYFRQSGTLEQWQEKIAIPCRRNTRLEFAVSCGFAAPLLALTDSESGGFNLRGDSSLGKTTAQWAAGSVCGGGGIIGYLIPWRATVNGLENIAVAHCDSLLVLDEISQAEPRAIGQAAYLLANGQGAGRMRRDTSSRPIATWRILFLSSGEMSLAAKVQDRECIYEYSSPEVAVSQTLSLTSEGVLYMQSCAKQRKILDVLAQVPRDERDEVIARAVDRALR